MRDPNKFRKIALPVFFGALFVLLIVAGFVESEAIIALAALLAAAFIALYLIFWRCPGCGRLLPNGRVDYCPYCGQKFGKGE